MKDLYKGSEVSFSNRRLPIGENVIKLCDLSATLSGIVENEA